LQVKLKFPAIFAGGDDLPPDRVKTESAVNSIDVGSLHVQPTDLSVKVGSLHVQPTDLSVKVGSLQLQPTDSSINVGSLQLQPTHSNENVGFWLITPSRFDVYASVLIPEIPFFISNRFGKRRPVYIRSPRKGNSIKFFENILKISFI